MLQFGRYACSHQAVLVVATVGDLFHVDEGDETMRFANRVEVGNVVTASNLFKYCAPGHGLLLFKHHDPLTFSASDVQQLLLAGSLWFDAAAEAAAAGQSSSRHAHASPGAKQRSMSHRQTPVPPSQLGGATAPAFADSWAANGDPGPRLWPLLLWNNLPRAGASQFHGHAQVALSEVGLQYGVHHGTFSQIAPQTSCCLVPASAALALRLAADCLTAQVPFPADMHMMQAAAAHAAQHCGACCYDDTKRAHAALGLAHELGPLEDRRALLSATFLGRRLLQATLLCICRCL